MKKQEQQRILNQMQAGQQSKLVKTPHQQIDELHTHMPQALGILNKNQYLTALQIEELKDTILVLLLMMKDMADAQKLPVKSIKEYAEKIQSDRAEFQKMQEEAQKAAAEGKQLDAPTESQEPTGSSEETQKPEEGKVDAEPQTSTIILTDKD